MSTKDIALQRFPAMPSSAGSPIVESGSNSDGEWIKWADGTLECYRHRFTLAFVDVRYCTAEWIFPSPFINTLYETRATITSRADADVAVSSGFDAVSVVTENLSGPFTGNRLSTRHYIAVMRSDASTGDFAAGDMVHVSVGATGRWK